MDMQPLPLTREDVVPLLKLLGDPLGEDVANLVRHIRVEDPKAFLNPRSGLLLVSHVSGLSLRVVVVAGQLLPRAQRYYLFSKRSRVSTAAQKKTKPQ